MEEKSLIGQVRAAASKLKGCKLLNLKEVETELAQIGKATGLASNTDAMIFVAIVDRQSSNDSTSLQEMTDYFKCTSLDVMEMVPSIIGLLKKGYIRSENEEMFDVTKMELKLVPEIFTGIIERGEMVMPAMGAAPETDQFEFCRNIDKFIVSRHRGQIETSELFHRSQLFEEKYDGLKLVSETKALLGNIQDRVLFYEMCNDFVSDIDEETGTSDLNETLKDVFDRTIDFVNVKKTFQENRHELLKADLVELENDGRKIIVKLTEKGIKMLMGDDASMYLNRKGGLGRYEFVKEINLIADELPDSPSSMNLRCMARKVVRLEEANSQLEFVKTLVELLPCMEGILNRTIFYLVGYELINSDKFYLRQLSAITTKKVEMELRRQFKNKTHPLQKLGLAETTKGGLFGNEILKLTDEGKKLYLEEDVDLFTDAVPAKNLISCEKIVEKKLYFSSDLERQLNSLRNSLEQGNYETLRERLDQSKLSKGIAVLLYGYPGTGKTESVMQIARATGRSIMHVDISSTKSCWFGESEKLIKEVFDRYRSLCEKSEIKPILLFNEADGVFAKRKDSASSSVSQTENAIQNIILEEMENLDGIMIATTNLADNLDKAFERRFLFKIRFDKPAAEAKEKIWKMKLPTLSDEKAAELATIFDFSGGEIDNISRKVLVEELVKGRAVTDTELTTLCKEEKMSDNRQIRIGFN